ncbi:MAG: Fic family protein, partial [Actinobacteria bacterium]|nr:Fic family protein [Actinomycetota bacterium]
MSNRIVQLEKLPLSNRLIRNAHATLLQGVRGEHKLPGEFRRSQNWIGGSSISDAVFIPPHHESLPDIMSNFENFLHNEQIALPHLIKIGIAHYQFETIHPFLDGNGRIGRLLITLYLIENKLLGKPTLYLSDFFEKNRSYYYDNLQRTRTHNNLVQWLKFFLQGVITTSENSVQTFHNILTLKEKVDNIIAALGKRQANARKLVQYLYTKPIVDVKQTAELLQADFSTAKRLIDALLKTE